MSGTSAPDDDPLAHVTALCDQHRQIFFKADTDKIWDRALGCHRYVQCWKVYRRLPGGRSTYLGKRRDPAQLLAFVKKLI